MANMIMNTIYNQYLTTYAPRKSDTRYDAHKRSELRNIYNSMVKVNRDAPLYILENSSNMREYVVGMKEEARELRNTIISTAGDADHIDFSGKVAYSSDENVLSAKYVGKELGGLPHNEDETELGELPNGETEAELGADQTTESNMNNDVVSKSGEVPSYQIEVKALASSQVNLGKFLPTEPRNLAYGDYSFDVNVGDFGYEFQFSVQPSDSNLDIQNRLLRLINNSNIGLKSTIETDENGNNALRIESIRVGLGDNDKAELFSIKDNQAVKLNGSVDYLGLNYVAQPPSNAQLVIDGEEVSASSNTFVLESKYEIELHNISPNEGQTTTVGIKPDTEALQEHILSVLRGYNSFVKSISKYQESQSRSAQLVKEFDNLSGYYDSSFEKIGITKDKDGGLSLDNERLNHAVAMNESEEGLSALKRFSKSMIFKTEQVSLNPINYVNKKIVAYKNPGNTFTSPYVSSTYAGMMFNGYC